MSASHGARSARLGPSPLPGPDSLQQLFEFPAESLARLCSGTDGPASRDRLARNLELQWVFTEDYAGMSTASMALGMIAAEAEAAGLTSAPPFSMHRVCDNNSLCHRVLGCDPDLSLRGSCCLAPKHVFGDLNDRLQPDLKRVLEFLGPDESMTKQEKQRTFNSMRRVLQENGSDNFFASQTAPCSLHAGRMCPLHPEPQDLSRSEACMDSARSGPLMLRVVDPRKNGR